MLREIQRQRAQAASGFKNFEVLDGRYVLLNLLGKGGFSEVYKSFDLQELRFVACKIHQLGSGELGSPLCGMHLAWRVIRGG